VFQVCQIARLKRLRQLMAKTVLHWKNLVVGRCFSQLHDDCCKRERLNEQSTFGNGSNPFGCAAY
jgi:hypothetical protein